MVKKSLTLFALGGLLSLGTLFGTSSVATQTSAGVSSTNGTTSVSASSNTGANVLGNSVQSSVDLSGVLGL